MPTSVCLYVSGDFNGLNVEAVELKQNQAASQNVLDIHIYDRDDGLAYLFDYAASRYEQKTMTDFQELFKRVVAAIVHNVNIDGYQFKQLMNDVSERKGLAEKIKEILFKK